MFDYLEPASQAAAIGSFIIAAFSLYWVAKSSKDGD